MENVFEARLPRHWLNSRQKWNLCHEISRTQFGGGSRHFGRRKARNQQQFVFHPSDVSSVSPCVEKDKKNI